MSQSGGIGAFDADDITALTPEAIGVFGSTHIDLLSPEAIGAFGADDMALSPGVFSDLDGETFAAFSGNAIVGLNVDHVSNLPADIFALTDGAPNYDAIAQIGYMTSEAITGLSPENINVYLSMTYRRN